RLSTPSGTTLGNLVELQVNQGKLKEAAATVERLKALSPFYGEHSRLIVLFAEGNDKVVRQQIDSLLRAGGEGRTRIGFPAAAGVALRDGRLHDFTGFWKQTLAGLPSSPDEEIYRDGLALVVKGPSATALAQLDSAIARIPFKQLPMVDRPYLLAA